MTDNELKDIGFCILIVWFGIMFVGMWLALKDEAGK